MTINKLQTIAAELSSTMSNLLEISKQKQEVLVNRDHDNLNALINQEQKLVTELNTYSNQQKLLTAKLKEEYGLPEQLTSLTKMLELIDSKIDVEAKQSIQKSLYEIKIYAEELGIINDQNKMLIETSREFIKGIIRAVRGNDNRSLINRKI